MGRDPLSVDLKAAPLDARDVAETDDRVAIWQHQLRIGQRAARYDHSDFRHRHRRDRSRQRTESPLASNSTGKDQRQRGSADDRLAKVPDFSGHEFPTDGGQHGKGGDQQIDDCPRTNLQGSQIARFDLDPSGDRTEMEITSRDAVELGRCGVILIAGAASDCSRRRSRPHQSDRGQAFRLATMGFQKARANPRPRLFDQVADRGRADWRSSLCAQAVASCNRPQRSRFFSMIVA